MRLTPFLAAVSAIVGGCTTLPQISRFSPAVETREEEIRNYTVGDQQRAYVGQAIIEKGRLTYSEISEGKFRALHTLSAGAFTITQGAVYSAIFQDRKDGSVYVQGDASVVGVFGAKVDGSGRLMNSNMYYYNLGGWQDNALTHIADVGTQIFEPTPSSRRYSPESFKSELLYLGKAGTDIRVSYREYKDDIARPAFYQDLSYDLSSSDVIRYKTFRVKVLDATNEELQYVVLEE